MAPSDRPDPMAHGGSLERERSTGEFLRDLAIWQHETDVPKKHGAKLLRVLRGSAKAVCSEIELSDLLSAKTSSHKSFKSSTRFQLETSLPRAFERAIYGCLQAAGLRVQWLDKEAQVRGVPRCWEWQRFWSALWSEWD